MRTEALIEGPGSTPDSNLTAMRIHEVGLQHWLNQKFVVKDGYPVPVVFSKPMDAFTTFQSLWKENRNPFNYLLELKNEDGTPKYKPFPEPAMLPLISINRRRWEYRKFGNFSIHKRRHISWPTVSDDVKQEDLGNVRVRNRPQGFNFHFDVTFWCLRPDTQALFIQNVWNSFWRSGGTPATWIRVKFPTEEGVLNVRMEMATDITDATVTDNPNEQIRYQTVFSVKVEGWVMDMNDTVVPAYWKNIIHVNIVNQGTALHPTDITNVYNYEQDLRSHEQNVILDNTPGIPDPAVVVNGPDL